MENSDTTICRNFLENLWPLILENNACAATSSDTCEYFVPEKNFDQLWAHQTLATKGFNDYEPVIELTCKAAEKTSTEMETKDEIEQLPYRESGADILSLDQQLAFLQHGVVKRKKLADDFANSQFPWYIQRCKYPDHVEITCDAQKLFKEKFELEILYSIQRFNCHLMIIDVALAVPPEYMERWLKFSAYASIVTVVHDRDLCRKLKNYNHVFKTVWLEENPGSTWQKELERSLDMGVKKAKELFLWDGINQAMVFVFSQSRGICVCNQYKILRKS